MNRHLVAAAVTVLGAQVGAVAPARAEETQEASSDAMVPEIAPRPWLYLDDPSLPPPLHAVAFTRATYARDESPTRPFGANVARPGGIV
jgi:hypothetical protein